MRFRFRLWRWYWRLRLHWRQRQLVQLQKQCAKIHAQCAANVEYLRALQRRIP